MGAGHGSVTISQEVQKDIDVPNVKIPIPIQAITLRKVFILYSL